MSDDNSEDTSAGGDKESRDGDEVVEDEPRDELKRNDNDDIDDVDDVVDDDDYYGFHGEDEAAEDLYYDDWRYDYDSRRDKAKAAAATAVPSVEKPKDVEDTEGLFSYVSVEGEGEYIEPLARYSESLGIPGVARINLSPLTQKIIGCVIDENVTTEYPWLYVRRELIDDNLDLHSESSDFLPVKDEIEAYEEPEVLVGYAPTLQPGAGQFYICLSLDSRRAVEQHIEELRREQQARVSESVIKKPGIWEDLGSAKEVDEAAVVPRRALYEIEVKTKVERLQAPVELHDRKSDSQRDAYVEVVPYRETFTNVERLLVDQDAEAIPKIKTNDSQTETAMLINASNQCQLDREPKIQITTPLTKKTQEKLNKFLKSKVNDVCEQIFTNTTWDVYANDYANLAAAAAAAASATSEEGTKVGISTSTSVGYVERQIYYEGNLCRGRVINDLSWHPFWTGVAATVYTPTGKSENLIGRKPPDKEYSGDNQVLIWSFDDCLRPKLILEAKRQVTAVSFCPHNGNIVVGGCKNGQVVLWDISGKIENVERIIVRTAAQAKHSTVVKSLSTWMKEAQDSSIIRPTVTSNLQHSQKEAITKIEWLSPYRKITDRGIVEDLPADTPEADLTDQFVTSSEDGSIAFWDLSLESSEEDDKKKGQKKKEQARKKKVVEKPQALQESISPYKKLDDTYKPIYMIIVPDPDTSRNVVLTALSVAYPTFKKLQIEPIPRSDDITRRRYYSMQMKRNEEEEKISRKTEIFVATVTGECGLVSWEGFDFATGISVNKEVARWTWRKQVHDGPVSHVVRSRHLKDLVLTVGGKIFAVWREDFEEPILWRKSDLRYTACCWDAHKPTAIILGRNDGTVEIWDIIVKSHEPHVIQSLSGRIITGIYAHELPLGKRCLAFCDYNGALRIFLAPEIPRSRCQKEAKWMLEFVTREVDRIKDFIEWQKKWIKLTTAVAEEAAEGGGGVEEGQKVTGTEDLRASALTEDAARLEADRKTKTQKRKQLVEEMRERWVKRELNRMQRAILLKKGLREEELARRREPVLRMQREAEAREARQRRIIERAPELFEEAVASNFPQQRRKLIGAFTLPAKTRGAEKSVTSIEQQQQQQLHAHESATAAAAAGDSKTAEEEIIDEYERIENTALDNIRTRSRNVNLEFSWRQIVEEGLSRRKALDYKRKAHKKKEQITSPSNQSVVLSNDLVEENEDESNESNAE